MSHSSHAMRETKGLGDSELTKTINNTSAKRLFTKTVCVRSFYIRKKKAATAIETWTFSTFGKTLEKVMSYSNGDKAYQLRNALQAHLSI